MERTLTITINHDWRTFLTRARDRAIAATAESGIYQGEWLKFESAAAISAHLTQLRWDVVREMIGAGRISVRELALRLGRDGRHVRQGAHSLADLGLFERHRNGAWSCRSLPSTSRRTRREIRINRRNAPRRLPNGA